MTGGQKAVTSIALGAGLVVAAVWVGAIALWFVVSWRLFRSGT